MGDIVSDGTSFSCPLCTGQLKISVPSSSAKGDSKNLANTGNYLFPPPGAQCLLIPSAPAPCAPPSVSVLDPGQSAVDIDGKKALGAGCKLQCAKSGLLTVASSGQSSAQHDGAASGKSAGEIAAAAAVTPAAAQTNDKPEEKEQKDKKTAKQKNVENKKRDGTPKNNQAQNKEFNDAVKKVESEIDRKLSKDEVRRLHQTISKQDLSYHEIVEEGISMYTRYD